MNKCKCKLKKASSSILNFAQPCCESLQTLICFPTEI